MFYIMVDYVEGTILGLSDEPQLSTSNGWLSLSEEAYNFILDNNGHYIVDISSITDKIEVYKNEVFKLKTKQIKSIAYIVVNVENLKEPEKKLDAVKINRIEKNNNYCNMYIENGISYTFKDGTSKRYSYKTEDQINFSELRTLYNEGILTDKDAVPLKAVDESTYELVSIKTIIDIHNKLIKNKHYQLFYLRQMNEYVNSLTSINDIHRLQYEMNLPEKYQEVINKQMEAYSKL